MFPWAAPLLLCSLSAVHADDGVGLPFAVPRNTVMLLDNNGRLFTKKGISNYSSMLLREDHGVLVVGARDAIFALDMHNISRKKSKVEWPVSKHEFIVCIINGKTKADCRNFIRNLHEMKDGRMYVCGTHAFRPTCEYLAWNGGQLHLEGMREDGAGKCPFNPHHRYASLMAYGDLYTATTKNIFDSEWGLARHSPFPLSTNTWPMWFSDPQFISLVEVSECEGSQTCDDDKIYLFFSEFAMEYDFYKTVVPRVARVCKSDKGGLLTLRRNWSSYVKASLHCPVPDSGLHLTLQDVFLWRDSDWRKSVFYATFMGSGNMSAVCAYSVDAVSRVFSSGKFKQSINVDDGSTKWFMYEGEIPVPRPGACINNEMRAMGINQSLDIPDSTLMFLLEHMLMDTVVMPLQTRPLLLFQETVFTRIAVDSVTALDGQRYTVMFIGTERGSVLKAVNYGADAVIIEEIKMFPHLVPIEALLLSTSTGLLYATSSHGVAQVPLRGCGRYKSCLDCVLARDPYCAWDPTKDCCTDLLQVEPSSNRELFQRVKDGDASVCPELESVETKTVTVGLGHIVELSCLRGSNLAQTDWRIDGKPLSASQGVYIYGDNLLVQASLTQNWTLYECQSVEQANGKSFVTRAVMYRLLVPELACASCNRMVLIIVVVVLSVLFVILLVWTIYQATSDCRGSDKYDPGH